MLPTELLLDPALRLGSAVGLTALYGAVCGGVLWREGRKRKAKAALGRKTSRKAVYHRIARGQIPAVRLGRSVFIRRADLAASLVPGAFNEPQT